MDKLMKVSIVLSIVVVVAAFCISSLEVYALSTPQQAQATSLSRQGSCNCLCPSKWICIPTANGGCKCIPGPRH
jgi:hypothetical protein